MVHKRLWLRFNPTMVRLLLAKATDRPNFPMTFQSHNGAIAARQRTNRSRETAKFQSHNGAIAAPFDG